MGDLGGKQRLKMWSTMRASIERRLVCKIPPSVSPARQGRPLFLEVSATEARVASMVPNFSVNVCAQMCKLSWLILMKD